MEALEWRGRVFGKWNCWKSYILCIHSRDQREWVFEVREVKSERKKAFTLFREVQSEKNAFTLFREVQSGKNAFTLFQEVNSEIKMLRDREVKIFENS